MLYLQSFYLKKNWHQNRIAELITKKLFGTLSGKKINVLGFSFKANTNDTRESAAIQICKQLIDEGANLYIHDPKVNPTQIAIDLNLQDLKDENNLLKNESMSNSGSWQFMEKLDNFGGAHAVVILTEWEEYSNLDWEKVASQMVNTAWVFDARSIIEPIKVKNAGLKLWRIGDGSI